METTDLLHEFEQQALNPPAGDERIAAFSQSMLNLSGTNEGLGLIGAVINRKLETATYGARLLLLSVQKQLLRRDPTYPLEYDEADKWSRSIVEILHSPEQSADLINDLTTRNAQSNVVERYKAFKLAMAFTHPLNHAPLKILDVGCSRNHGLQKLHLNLPFQPIECGLDSSDGFVSSTVLNRLCNNVLATPQIFGESLGLDIIDIDDASNAEWARNCSFYPSEFLDRAAVAEYDYLEAAKSPNVGFRQGSVLELPNYRIGKFDVITVSTFLYQLTPAQRDLTRLALAGALTEKGVIIYQDFTKRSRSGTDMEYRDGWFSTLYPYRTLVEVPSIGGGEVFEIVRWSNGRCKQWVPGRDLERLINIVDVA